jgi:Cell division protein
MRRDAQIFKPNERRSPRAPWLWLLTGLLIGLFVTFLINLDERAPEGPDAADKQPLSEPHLNTVRKTGEIPAGDAGSKPAPPTLRFEFYKILPEMEVVIPEEKTMTPLRPAPGRLKPHKSPPKSPINTSAGYVLQAGAFRKLEEADRRKATLALLGIEASIETVSGEGETWYRVRIGPYKNPAESEAVRARLKARQINTVLVRISG